MIFSALRRHRKDDGISDEEALPNSQNGDLGLGVAGILEQMYTPMNRGLIEKERHRENKHGGDVTQILAGTHTVCQSMWCGVLRG